MHNFFNKNIFLHFFNWINLKQSDTFMQITHFPFIKKYKKLKSRRDSSQLTSNKQLLTLYTLRDHQPVSPPISRQKLFVLHLFVFNFYLRHVTYFPLSPLNDIFPVYQITLSLIKTFFFFFFYIFFG